MIVISLYLLLNLWTKDYVVLCLDLNTFLCLYLHHFLSIDYSTDCRPRNDHNDDMHIKDIFLYLSQDARISSQRGEVFMEMTAAVIQPIMWPSVGQHV